MTSPSHFTPVALHHASRLINHGPTVLVTSAHGGRRNIMAAAWSMPVEFTPPRIAVVIDKSTFTRELIAASGAFAICLPGTALADLTFAVGSASGRDEDKFARHGHPGAHRPGAGHAGAGAGLRRLDGMPPDPRAAHPRRLRHLLCRSGGRCGRCAHLCQRPLGATAATTPSCNPSTTWAPGKFVRAGGVVQGVVQNAVQPQGPA
jgi:hypothetical protein